MKKEVIFQEETCYVLKKEFFDSEFETDSAVGVVLGGVRGFKS